MAKHISYTCAVFLVLVQSVSIPAHTRVAVGFVNANVFTLVTWISRVALVDRCVKYVLYFISINMQHCPWEQFYKMFLVLSVYIDT